MTGREAMPIERSPTAEQSIPAYVADYQVQRVLGHGNNGRIFLARPPQRLGLAEEFVAVKALHGPCHDAVYERAVEELRAISALDSPFLAKVFEAGLERTSFFYAMDYIVFGSLAAPGRPLSQTEVLLAVSHAASAAHALHEAGIAHTAIKPQNVLIGTRCALLSDVGLGRYLQPGLTTTGVASAGAVEYVDPIVLRGGAPSRSSDVWALGATLHRALTGVGLYGELPANAPLLAIRRVMSGNLILAQHLSPDFADLIRDCLASPDQRIPTAAAVAHRLTDLARGGGSQVSGE